MGDSLELNVKLAMQSQSFQQQIATINREMKVVQSEFNNASSRLGEFGSATDKLRAKSQSLNQQIELGRNKIKMYSEAVAKSRETLEKNVTANQKLKQKLEETTRAYTASVNATGKNSAESRRLHGEVTQLTQEYNTSNSVIANNSRALDNNTIRANNAGRSVNGLEGQLRETDRELQIQSSHWTTMGTRMTEAGTKMQKVGKKLSEVGESLTTKLTVPIVGVGVGVSKLAIDFEDSMAKVSTISDDAQVPIGDLRKSILKLSDDTGVASTDIANDVYDAISAGQSTGDAINFVTKNTKLAKAGFAETGQSLDLLTTILNSYGLKSSEVGRISDVLIQTQNKGKVTVAELSSSMGKVIPTAKSLGVNLEQVASGYAIMTSKGIKSAETTTYMASMFNELGKSGTTANKAVQASTGKTFPELIKSGKSVGDVLNSMNVYAKKNGKSLSDMFGSAEAGKSALILSGNEGKDFNEMLKDMGNSAGATDTAFGKVSNTTGNKLKKSLNSLKNEGIKFGDALAPLIEKLAKGMEILAKKLEALSPKQIDFIIKTAKIVAVVGPVILIIGKLATAIGAVMKVFGLASTAMGVASATTAGVGTAGTVATGGIAGLGASFGAVLLPMLPFIAGIGAVVGAGYLIKKSFSKDATPAVDLFADKVTTAGTKVDASYAVMSRGANTNTIKITEATKKAVGAYVDLDTKATKSLTDLYVNSTVITAKNSASVVGQYKGMANKIKLGLDTRYKSEEATMKAFFAKSNVLSTADEAKALAKLKKDNNAKKVAQDNYVKQIQAIVKSASDKKRALTLDEQQKINAIQDKMKSNGIKTLSKSEQEAKVIQDRMKSYGTRVTAEQASSIIKSANKQRDGVVKGANDQYSKSVASIKRMRDESHSITAQQANKLIADAGKQRDGTVNKAESMRNGVVNKVTNMNSSISGSVNTTTGDILSKWDNLKSWWDNWIPSVKTFFSKMQTDGSSGKMNGNWTGNNNYEGGLTTLHERGYEVYNLPKASKIYNHDASEAMVMETAKQVAQGVMEQSQSNQSNGQQTIIVPVNLDGREIAKLIVNPLSEELERKRKNQSFGMGGVY